ncbi:MAG: hypothetical protein K6F77_00465 [Lachnospiraceae bacterium]|nr:hypothetical protein [Lachnospiraceae bacterium]
MTNLKEYADLYRSKGIWVYPHIDMRESLDWNHWKGLSDAEYQEEYNGFDWNSALGINVITGRDGICVLYFSRDTDDSYTQKSIKTLLNLLGLPQDYEWLYMGNTYIALVIEIVGDIGKAGWQRYKEIHISYKDKYILPPGFLEHSSYECFFKCGLPKNHPIKVSNTTFLKCLEDLNNIDLVDTGERARKTLEIRKGLKVGCGCLTILAMGAILAAMGVFDGEQLGFMETILVLISMVALFALGAYITRDT